MFEMIIYKTPEYENTKNLFAIAKTKTNDISFVAYFEFFKLKAFYVNSSYWIKGEIKDGGSRLDIYGENEKTKEVCVEEIKKVIPSNFTDVTKDIFVYWEYIN